MIDRVVAPIMYRILFRPGRLDAEYARELVTNALDGPEGRLPEHVAAGGPAPDPAGTRPGGGQL